MASVEPSAPHPARRASVPVVLASALAAGVLITGAAGVAFRAINGASAHAAQATQLYSIASNGTDLRRLTSDDQNHDWGPAWSPDGLWLAFTLVTPDAPPGQLFVSNPDGTNARQITHDAFGGYC